MEKYEFDVGVETVNGNGPDGAGNVTIDDYLTGLSVNGKVITYSKKNGTSGTITTQDTVYTHPTTSGNKHIPSGGSSGQILRWSADGTAAWGADNNTTYSNMTGATSSAAGTSGLVPAPGAGKNDSPLCGDGTFKTLPIAGGGTGATTASEACANIGALPTTGGTVTGDLLLKGSSNVVAYEGEPGVEGYIHLAQLKINRNYVDYPIKFEISRRRDATSTMIYIMFVSVENKDPALSSFVFSGPCSSVFLHKSDTSTWDLYVQKSQGWDNMTIERINKPLGISNNAIHISLLGTLVTSLPAGYTQALPDRYSNVPVGTVIAFAANFAPSGYLLCDGSAVSRTSYARLFSVIGTIYGSGDGSTTFNLPNLTNKFIQGSATAGTVKSAGLPNITGSPFIVTLGSQPTSSSGCVDVSEVKNVWGLRSDTVIAWGNGKIDASKSDAIYGNSTTVQPPALTMRYIIKY